MRILKEFPWLWGVRQNWSFVHDKLSVAETDEDLRRFLYDDNPDEKFEVWIFHKEIGIQYTIDRVTWNKDSLNMMNYAQRITQYLCHHQESLEYIALVQNIKGGDGVVALDHTRARIYRPRKNESLDAFIRLAPVAILSQ